MAGETEDCSSPQANCLATGSISFGRFEAESLSWERRSSFSHNRYLEEVEKYSTPGSVTQKKAYFEAHFKKKGRLPYAFPEGQNEFEFRTAEDGCGDHMSYVDDYLDDDNGEHQQFAWHDQQEIISNECEKDILEGNVRQIQLSWYDENSAMPDEFKHDVIDNSGGQPHFDFYDETPVVSDEQENDTMEHEEEEIVSPESPPESSPTNDEIPSMHSNKLGEDNKNKTFKIQPVDLTILADKEEFHVAVEQETNTGHGTVDRLEKGEIPSERQILDKSRSSAPNTASKVSSKVKTAAGQKPAKSKPNPSSTRFAQRPRREYNSLSSDHICRTASNTIKRESPARTKREKQSSYRAPSHKTYDSKNHKSEDFEILRAKARQAWKSEKDQFARKVGVLPRSNPAKHNADIRRSTERSQMSYSSTKEDPRQSNAVFSFKSDERAEKRKEYYVKLEEKQHAKEVEMNEIKARTQEETEAEIKQLRRSLNFKATPMPAFYHETMTKRKNAVPQAKSTPLQSKPASPTSKSSLKDKPQLGNQDSQFRDSTSSIADNQGASEGDTTALVKPKASPSKTNQASKPSKKLEVGKKDERSKLSVQQQQVERQVKEGERLASVRRPGIGKTIRGGLNGSVAVRVAS